MSFDPKRTARPARVTVWVHLQLRGHWEVVSPDEQSRITCETLEEPRRIAHLAVPQAHECELIVRDAYNRILEHELVPPSLLGRAGRGPSAPIPRTYRGGR